jgi:hypothetical protein
MKAHYPIEFAVANLNHAKTDASAIKILRDMAENEQIDYIPVDADESEIKWCAWNGKLLGGLTNIHGIGVKKAQEILKNRKEGKAPSPGTIKKLMNPVTPFDILYPCEHHYGDYYNNHFDYGMDLPPSKLVTVKEAGSHTFLGRIFTKDLRDLNEYNEVVKRGGKVYEKNSKDLRLVVEDDTGQMLCKINRFAFDDMGAVELYEQLQENKSYVLIKGDMKEGWRMINIKAIYNLGIPAE